MSSRLMAAVVALITINILSLKQAVVKINLHFLQSGQFHQPASVNHTISTNPLLPHSLLRASPL